MRSETELGLVHLLNNDLPRAGMALTNSRSLDPSEPRTLFLLGPVRLGQGQADEARTLFEQVPASSSVYAAARRQLAELGRGSRRR